MEREFSAGGAVIRYIDGKWCVAVIEPQPSAGKPARQSHVVMALPKGLVDQGERPAEAAVREVQEETGIEGELVTKLSDIRYVYVRSWGDGQRVFKVVSFYLLRYRAGQVDDITADMRIEVKRAEWIPLNEAPRRLTHRGERDVAQLALDYVASHPELASSQPVPQRIESPVRRTRSSRKENS
jgi:8-oxo-dGTP pyrophosphatase MutT (NUDIX family)